MKKSTCCDVLPITHWILVDLDWKLKVECALCPTSSEITTILEDTTHITFFPWAWSVVAIVLQTNVLPIPSSPFLKMLYHYVHSLNFIFLIGHILFWIKLGYMLFDNGYQIFMIPIELLCNGELPNEWWVAAYVVCCIMKYFNGAPKFHQ